VWPYRDEGGSSTITTGDESSLSPRALERRTWRLMTRGLSSFWDELVATENDPQQLLELIVRRVAEVVGEASVLTTVSEDGETLEPVAVFHADPEVSEFIRAVLASAPYRLGDGVAGDVAARREPVVLSGIDRDQLAATGALHARKFLQRYPIRSLVIVPMVASGEVIGTLGAVRTASELPYVDEDVMVLEALAERAALALAEARRRPRRIGLAEYEAIFQQSVDGVLFTAPDGRILAANPAACEILRRSEAEICRVGRAGILVDDPSTHAAVAQRAVSGSARAELPMRRGDGEVFIADVSSTIFNTAEGDVRASVIFRDVSERVRSQAEFAKQHHHLALLHGVATAINEATDLTTAIQHTLDAVGAATGWPIGDALLLSDDGVLRPSAAWRVADPDRFDWFPRWMEATTLSADEGLAGRVVTSAAAVWVSDLCSTDEFVRSPPPTSAPLRTYVGVPIMVGTSAQGVLELFSDVSRPRDDGLLSVLVDLGTQLGRALERSEADAAHQRLDEERAAFVARAAHELRSPVASLVLAVGVLGNRQQLDPQDQKLLDVVVGSTEHLHRLVNRLLDLSKLEQGAPEITIMPIEVCRVVERSLATHPTPSDHTVTCHVQPGSRAMGDELWLGQIVTNLVGNACRHGGEAVEIDAWQEGGSLELSVSDNGPGVDPAIERSIFEPFVRGPGQRGDGAGLGLAISRRLAEAMGGSLRYERRDGGGSRFIVELPGVT
jgi:PAS domain S-box-containing protein